MRKPRLTEDQKRRIREEYAAFPKTPRGHLVKGIMREWSARWDLDPVELWRIVHAARAEPAAPVRGPKA